MGLFGWLKKKKVEVEEEFVPDVETQNEVDFQEEEKKNNLFIRAVLSNKTLTVFVGENVYTNTNADRQMLVDVQNASSSDAVRAIMLGNDFDFPQMTKVTDALQDKAVIERLSEIIETGDFVELDNVLYMKGIDIPIPLLLAQEIIKAGEKETSEYYDALKNFWCWCALNPDPVARQDLFGFLERGDFKITSQGFFLGFRNVEVVGGEEKDKNLVEFISSKYLNIKVKQKKSPRNYWVFSEDGGTYSLHKDNTTDGISQLEGNLADLYNSLTVMKDNEYTDARTRSMKIKIGEVVKMDRTACDSDPNSECSRGLHIGNRAFGYSGFGNTTIVVIVNPMNVVAVPNHRANKMRVCEYFPLAALEGEPRDWLEDADTLSLETEYINKEVGNLFAEIAKGKISGEGTTIATQVTLKLEEMQFIVGQRVVNA